VAICELILGLRGVDLLPAPGSRWTTGRQRRWPASERRSTCGRALLSTGRPVR